MSNRYVLNVEKLPPLEAIRHERIKRNPAIIFEYQNLIPDHWQLELLTTPAQQSIVLCGRQQGKSKTAETLAIGQALKKPNSLILIMSPALRQSGELFAKIVKTYKAIGSPIPIVAESALRMELANGSRIISLPGSEETVRGYSAVDLLILDEASRIPDSLYHAVRPFLAVGGGKLILLSTPFGKRGFFYETWSNKDGKFGDWFRVRRTCWDNPRLTKQYLDQELATSGPWWFKQEYECEFVETDDQFFTTELIESAFSDDVEPLIFDLGAH